MPSKLTPNQRAIAAAGKRPGQGKLDSFFSAKKQKVSDFDEAENLPGPDVAASTATSYPALGGLPAPSEPASAPLPAFVASSPLPRVYLTSPTERAAPALGPVPSLPDTASPYPQLTKRADWLIGQLCQLRDLLLPEMQDFLESNSPLQIREELLKGMPDSIKAVLDGDTLNGDSFWNLTDEAATNWHTSGAGVYLINLRIPDGYITDLTYFYTGSSWGEKGLENRISHHMDPDYRAANMHDSQLYRIWQNSENVEVRVRVLLRLQCSKPELKVFWCLFFETFFCNFVVSWSRYMIHHKAPEQQSFSRLIPSFKDTEALLLPQSGEDIHAVLRVRGYRGTNNSIPILENFARVRLFSLRDGNPGVSVTLMNYGANHMRIKLAPACHFKMTQQETKSLVDRGVTYGDKAILTLEFSDDGKPHPHQWANVPVLPQYEQAYTMAVKLSGIVKCNSVDEPWECYLQKNGVGTVQTPQAKLKRAMFAMSLMDLYYGRYQEPAPSNRVALIGCDDKNPKIWEAVDVIQSGISKTWTCPLCHQVLNVAHTYMAESDIKIHQKTDACRLLQGLEPEKSECTRCKAKVAPNNMKRHLASPKCRNFQG